MQTGTTLQAPFHIKLQADKWILQHSMILAIFITSHQKVLVKLTVMEFIIHSANLL